MRILALLLAISFMHSTVLADEICFPLADGTRMLQDIESLPLCRAAVWACEDSINSCEARADALESRVIEQDKEIEEGKKTIEDTVNAGEEAAKIAAGPWYQRILTAGKWIALGALFGLAVGVSK